MKFYTKELMDVVQGAPTIKSYSREQTFYERLQARLIAAEDSNVQMKLAQGGSNTANLMPCLIFVV